jgi:hypothetical protein
MQGLFYVVRDLRFYSCSRTYSDVQIPGAISAYSKYLHEIHSSRTYLHSRLSKTQGSYAVHEPNRATCQDGRFRRVRAVGDCTVSIADFFTSFDYAKQYPRAIKEIGAGLADGSIKRKFHIVEGLQNAPSALPMLFAGTNTGKL